MAAALAAAGCHSGENPRKTGGRAGAVGPTRQDALGSIYPPAVPPLPVARELCDALHAIPAERAAACCGTRPDDGLRDQCVRALSASLRDGAVELDEASVATCRADTERALAGCDWVTPSEPLAPPACQRLLRGKLGAGRVCRSSLECAGRMHCDGLGPTKTGICAEPAALGEVCGSHVDVLATYTLERGLETTHPFCAESCSLATHRCEAAPVPGSSPAGKTGDRCGTTPCAAGLRCRQGLCVPLAAAGEACVADLDCAAGGCSRHGGGEKTCGAKCSPSFEALSHGDAVPAMALPARPPVGQKR